MQTGHNTGRRREEEREERRGEEEERERRRRLGFGGVSAPIGCVSTLVILKKRKVTDSASTFTQATSYLRSIIIIFYPSLPKVLIKDGQTRQTSEVKTFTFAESS